MNNQVKVYLMVLAIMFAGVFGVREVNARIAEHKARVCGSYPAVEMHFRAVIGDGETRSDWLTHLPVGCRETIYQAGLRLNDALDFYEVPELDHIDDH